jgi:hypothetical protein
MPQPPLAQPGDVEDRLGRELSGTDLPRVLALLDDASALVRSYTGQQISEATTTERIAVRNGTVRLPQRPATAVTTVNDPTGSAVTFVWGGGDVLTVLSLPVWVGPGAGAATFVDVTYTHGYDPIPDDIVAVVCDTVGRSFSGYLASPAIWQQPSAGINPEAVGAIIPTPALGGAQLTADQRAVLDRYRRVVGIARML